MLNSYGLLGNLIRQCYNGVDERGQIVDVERACRPCLFYARRGMMKQDFWYIEKYYKKEAIEAFRRTIVDISLQGLSLKSERC